VTTHPLIHSRAFTGSRIVAKFSSGEGSSKPFFMVLMTSIHLAASYPRGSERIRRCTFSPSDTLSGSKNTRIDLYPRVFAILAKRERVYRLGQHLSTTTRRHP